MEVCDMKEANLGRHLTNPAPIGSDSWKPIPTLCEHLCLHGLGVPEEFPAESLALNDGNAASARSMTSYRQSTYQSLYNVNYAKFTPFWSELRRGRSTVCAVRRCGPKSLLSSYTIGQCREMSHRWSYPNGAVDDVLNRLGSNGCSASSAMPC